MIHCFEAGWNAGKSKGERRVREFDEKAGQFVRVGKVEKKKVREEPKIRTLKPDEGKRRFTQRDGVEGKCDLCGGEGVVFQTDEGDFCAECQGKMSRI